MKSIKTSSLLLLLLTLLFSSCDKARVYEKNVDFDGYAWSYDNKVKFEASITDNSPKNLIVNFRHTYLFAKRNVRLKLHATTPKGETKTTAINIPLSEPNGMWYGDCTGDICDRSYALPDFKNYSFADTGTYVFELEQDMRQNPLKNTMAVGLRIENVEK